jgi:hypothetical protein
MSKRELTAEEILAMSSSEEEDSDESPPPQKKVETPTKAPSKPPAKTPVTKQTTMPVVSQTLLTVQDKKTEEEDRPEVHVPFDPQLVQTHKSAGTHLTKSRTEKGLIPEMSNDTPDADEEDDIDFNQLRTKNQSVVLSAPRTSNQKT